MANHVIQDSNFQLDVARWVTPAGTTIIHKFGSNPAVSTTPVPITALGTFQTPQVSGATTLRIKAGGNVADTAAGAGARAITLEGLSATGAEITETLVTNGTSASSSTSQSFIRLFRAYVSASGTYASQSAGSHTAAITIENTAGTANWGQIGLINGFPIAQTRIGIYTIPLGKVGYIQDITVQADSAKIASIVLFQRQNILETVAPYTAMRVLATWVLVGNSTITESSPYPLGPFPALTDIGFMGSYSAGTAAINTAFEVILVDE